MLSICCSERESGEAGEEDRLYQDNQGHPAMFRLKDGNRSDQDKQDKYRGFMGIWGTFQKFENIDIRTFPGAIKTEEQEDRCQ